MRTARHLAITLVACILLAACQSPDPQTPAATIAASTTPTATPTPTAAPPPEPTPSPSPEDYTIPPVIDEPYVQRVLTALYDLESEAIRQMVAAGALTAEAEATFRAVNRAEAVELDLASYRKDVAENFPGVIRPPGNQVVELEELISVYPDCVFARATRDFSQVVLDTSEVEGQTLLQLLPKPDDPIFARNPTPWIIGGSLLVADGEQREDPC